MGIRFLHTADWQLGMPAYFLGEEAAPRFQQARLDAVRRIGEVVRAEQASFVLVAGDVFDANLLSRQTVLRALEALATIPAPVFLLPGNHDPLDPTTVYRQKDFLQNQPPNVHVLAGEGIDPAWQAHLPPGVELVAAPWRTKHPADDPLGPVLAGLPPASERLRVAVGHGGVDALGGRDDLDTIRLDAVLRAVQEGRVHYVALGDRHSTTRLDRDGRVWYAGTPEATDFNEEDPGNVLLVDLEATGVSVRPIRVGTWRFVSRRVALNRADDIEELDRWLGNLPDKARTAVRLDVSGFLPLSAKERLDDVVGTAGATLAHLEVRPDAGGLRVRPDAEDLASLPPGSFARTVAEELRRRMERDDDDAAVAETALSLLLRWGASA